MASKIIRVSTEFKLLIARERKRLAQQTGLNPRLLTDANISKIISNKMSGKPSTIKKRGRSISIQ